MITRKHLTDFLKSEGIHFQYISNIDLEEELVFASLKKIVDFGIYYFEDPSILSQFNIKKSILIVNRKIDVLNNNVLIVDNPQLTHYKLTSLAVEKTTRRIAESSKISEHTVLGDNISIGEHCVLGKCTIENDVTIKHNVVIEDNVIIKSGSFIDSNSVIGAGGLAWIWDTNGERVIQQQLGGVLVEKNCYIATDVTIVKGSLTEYTSIGEGTVIAHGTKIGHGCIIGKYVHMANNVSLAGNAKIGDNCFLGSACIVSSNITVSNNNIVGAGALVNKNFEEEYITLAGIPAKVIKRENYKEKPKGAPKPYKKS